MLLDPTGGISNFENTNKATLDILTAHAATRVDSKLSGPMFNLLVFTIWDALRTVVMSPVLAFSGSSQLACLGCVFWLGQSSMLMVRNKTKSRWKASLNIPTPDFWHAHFDMQSRELIHYPCSYWDAGKGHAYIWASLLVKGKGFVKAMVNTQGQWCLIRLDKLRLSHLKTVDTLRLSHLCGRDCPQHCKAVNSIPDIYSEYLRDSSLLPLMTQNVHHHSCPLEVNFPLLKLTLFFHALVVLPLGMCQGPLNCILIPTQLSAPEQWQPSPRLSQLAWLQPPTLRSQNREDPGPRYIRNKEQPKKKKKTNKNKKTHKNNNNKVQVHTNLPCMSEPEALRNGYLPTIQLSFSHITTGFEKCK